MRTLLLVAVIAALLAAPASAQNTADQYKKACDAGVAGACQQLGLALEKGGFARRHVALAAGGLYRFDYWMQVLSGEGTNPSLAATSDGWIQFSLSIPEPTTLALLLATASLVLACRRRPACRSLHR